MSSLSYTGNPKLGKGKEKGMRHHRLIPFGVFYFRRI